MQQIRHVFRQIVTAVVVFMMIGMAPAPLVAADTPTTDTTTTTTPTPTPTPTPTVPDNGPTGPDAALFTYNSSTGLWENDYFTYDPTSKITTPKQQPEYTYNNQSGLWDALIWQFDTTSNQYKQVTISVPTPPEGAITHGGPNTTTPPANADSTLAPTPDTQSPGGNGTTPGDTNGNTVGNTTSTGIGNTVTSATKSGDATANDNNNVGTVSSGNATTTSTTVNQLQSQSSLTNGNVATFTANIQGNVTGDMVIDPANFTQNSASDPQALPNAKITNTNDGTIDNNITLSAATGNATANNNNNVQSVTTGDANAIADVINMINSVVAANQSFIGTINIYGDYTGNILMPADSLNALLSSASTVGSGGVVSNDAQYAVVNNVNLNALSGNASASDNNNVNNLSTGNALTNLTILNLTGHQVVASNCLLVFVNVMGTWVGLILDAPAGTNAAALGGGVTTNSVLPAGAQVTNNENYGINNNINVSATTGNATANDNNNVGTVATGNATASANITNIIGSNFSLSNWFGILFINVFGTWHGNFGLVQPPVVAPVTTPQSPIPPTGGSAPSSLPKAFAFVPKTTATSSSDTIGKYQLAPLGNTSDGSNGGAGGDVVQQTSAVLGATTKDPHGTPGNDIKQTLNQGINYWSVLLFAAGAAGFGLVGIERVRTNIRTKTTSGKK